MMRPKSTIYAILISACIWAGSMVDARAGVDYSTSLECDVISGATLRSAGSDYAADLADAIVSEDWALVRGFLLLGGRPPSNLTAAQKRRLKDERLSAELIPASARGDLKRVLGLIRRGADANVVAKADNYMSALAWASRCEHPKVVQALISHGAKVNERFGYSTGSLWVEGSTALIWASESGARESVSVLLANHADVNLQEEWQADAASPFRVGRTALGAATDPVVRQLLTTASGPKELR